MTRPLAQADALVNAIRAQGGHPLLCPLLTISPLDQAHQQDELAAAIAQLERYSLVIFVSANAVDYCLPLLLARGAWPIGLTAAAIGPSTVAALARFGISAPTYQVIAPSTRFDSEALAALPAFQEACGKAQRIIIFRGNGGREWLADLLRGQGAELSCVSCYQRTANKDSLAALARAWAEHRLDALAISSSESLRYLYDFLDTAGRLRLAKTPIFVPHPRIAELARSLNMQQVILTAPADAGIIASLSHYSFDAPA